MLPFDVAIEGDELSTTTQEREHFAGTEEQHFPPITGLPPMPWPGLRPLTNIWLRRAPVIAADTTVAAIEAFPWLFPGAPDEDDEPPLIFDRGVVLVTRVVAAPEADPAGDDEEAGDRWVSGEFDAALTDLNEFLVLLAAVSGETAIGAVTVKELPPLIPFFTSDPYDDLKPESPPPPLTSMLLVHVPDDDTSEVIPGEALMHMRDVQRLQHSRGHPFFPYAETIGSARRQFRLGRYAQAVLEATTAIEILTSTVIRETAMIRGADASAASGQASAPLRNRLEHHLPVLLGLAVDLDDTSTAAGRWYRGGYRLRNAVVHEGYRPSQDECIEALEQARLLMSSIGRALHADKITSELGEMLVTFVDDASGASTPERGSR